MISTWQGDQFRVGENDRVMMGEVTQHEEVMSLPYSI